MNFIQDPHNLLWRTAQKQWADNRWARARGTRDIPFATLVELFAEHPDWSLRQFAGALSISREGVRYIYDRYVRSLLGNPPWEQRDAHPLPAHRTSTWNRHVQRLLDEDSVLARVVRKARDAGCTVEFLSGRGVELVLRRRALLINGHRSNLYASASAKHPKPQQRACYSPLMLTPSGLATCDVRIIDLNVPGWEACTYVIPRDEYLRVYPDSLQRERTENVPVHQPRRYLSDEPPHVQYAKYREGWQYLAPKALEPDSS